MLWNVGIVSFRQLSFGLFTIVYFFFTINSLGIPSARGAQTDGKQKENSVAYLKSFFFFFCISSKSIPSNGTTADGILKGAYYFPAEIYSDRFHHAGQAAATSISDGTRPCNSI